MTTTTKTTRTTKATKATTKVKVAMQARPEIPPPAAVDPFAAPAAAGKSAPKGDGVHAAPTNDPELGNVAHDIAEFAAAKAAHLAAKAHFEAVSGVVLGYAKRVLCGLIARDGSKPKGQKLVGENDSVMTTFYQDRTVNVDDDAYAMLCGQFGQDVVDEQLIEPVRRYTVNPKKLADPALFAKITKVLQAGLTAAELEKLFEPAERTSRKGVVEQAAKLCGGDPSKIEQLLAVTVPKPTLK